MRGRKRGDRLVSQALFLARFLARSRFSLASSFRTASFDTLSDARTPRSKFSNWFGPPHLAFSSAIVSAPLCQYR